MSAATGDGSGAPSGDSSPLDGEHLQALFNRAFASPRESPGLDAEQFAHKFSARIAREGKYQHNVRALLLPAQQAPEPEPQVDGRWLCAGCVCAAGCGLGWLRLACGDGGRHRLPHPRRCLAAPMVGRSLCDHGAHYVHASVCLCLPLLCTFTEESFWHAYNHRGLGEAVLSTRRQPLQSAEDLLGAAI